MTAESTHVVTARVLDAGGDIVLSLAENSPGGVSFDAGRMPHVEGEISVALEDAMILEELDPRGESRRVVIDVDATLPTVSRTRTFNLGLGTVTPNRAEGTATLQLASDEALLDDFAQLVDDRAPRAHEASLRSLCNYVLGKIGAALQAGTTDANMTAYWTVQNMLPNPSAEAVLAPWVAAGNCSVFHASIGRTGGNSCGFTSTAAGVLAVSPTALADYRTVQAGKAYTLSTYARQFAVKARQIVPVIRWIDERNYTPWGDLVGAPVTLNDTAWTRAAFTAIAPPGAVKAFVFFRVTGSTAPSDIGYIDDAMFTQTAEAIPFFTGSTAQDAHYRYSWDDAANASTSKRTVLHDAPTPEAFIWRAGVSAMEFLENLLKAAALRLVCNELRQWTLRDAEYRAPGSQTYRHAVNIKDATEQLSRDSDDYNEGAVYEYIWTDAAGIEQRRLDAWAIVPNPTKVVRREVRSPYPGPGRAQAMVKRAASRGRTVTVTAIPTWLEQTDQGLSVRLEGSPIQTGTAGVVSFDFGGDAVTVTSRTTDTPANAIALFPEGVKIAQLVGKIAGLNVGDY